MRAQDVMTENVVTVSAVTSAEEAWETMRRNGIHHLVAKTGSKVVGVVSARDMGRPADAIRRGKTVADFMTPSVVTVDRTATINKVANLMRGRSIGSVVVTERGRAVGIITVADLLELIGRGGGRTAPQGERRGLHHRTAHRKKSSDSGMW